MNLILSLFTALLLTVSASAYSAETKGATDTRDRIKSFTQEITINKDGTLTIVEDIIAHKGVGNKIRRGIYRDLRTNSQLNNSSQYYSVIKVKRNGKEVPYTESKDFFFIDGHSPDHHRIYMGDMDIFLDKNKDYHYQLTYKTGLQITPSKTKDTLYYNIDGAEWVLPMNNVKSIIHAPSTIYNNYTANQRTHPTKPTHQLSPDSITLTTTTTRGNPNLAVKLSFEPGFIHISPWQTLKLKVSILINTVIDFAKQNPILFFSISALFQLLLYAFFFLKTKKNLNPYFKDLPTPVQYYPPKGISPGQSLAIFNGTASFSDFYRPGTLLSIIYTSLASKGLLKITNDDKVVIEKLPNTDDIDLPTDEKIVYGLLPKVFPISIDTALKYERQSNLVTKTIKEEFDNTLFDPTPKSVKKLSGFGYWMVPINLLTLPISGFTYLAASFWMLLVSLPAPLFLKRRSQDGQDIAVHLNGLRKFIDATKSNKYKIDPPPITPKYHNYILPYAIALGCDKNWSDFLEQSLTNGSIEWVKNTDNDDEYDDEYMADKSLPTTLSSLLSVPSPSTSDSSTSKRGSSSSYSSGGSSSGGGGGGGGGGGF